MPRRSPPERRSQWRTSTVRAGSAASSIGRNRATALLAWVSSGRTSTAPTKSGFHPSSPASQVASRRLRSSAESMACRSGTSDFTSTTRTARRTGFQANASSEPCSPRTLKVCSGRTSHPSAVSRATTWRTIDACLSSSSLGSSTPRHRGAKASETPTASATWRSSRIDAWPRSPLSTRETKATLTPAALATSS